MWSYNSSEHIKRVGVKPAAESFISLNSANSRMELLELRTKIQSLAKGVYTLDYLETLDDTELNLIVEVLVKERDAELKMKSKLFQ